MRRFTKLFTTLDEAARPDEQAAALEEYFRAAEPADAAWALHFLRGRKVPRAVTAAALREWGAAESQLPAWLFAECCETVGDLAETLALILPEPASTLDLPLHELISQRLLPMRAAPESARRELVLKTWRELRTAERFVWNKMITGGFRAGVAQSLVVRALAAVAGIEAPLMAHRLAGSWRPVAEDFQRLLRDSGADDLARPYAFCLASPLEDAPASLGEIAEWQAEWIWKGVRAQVIRRRGEALIWSRGEEIVTQRFPGIAGAAGALADGTVLDGEILGRADAPAILIAHDLIELNGEDLRARPLDERRRLLETVIATTDRGARETPDLFQFTEPSRGSWPLRLSEILRPASWEALAAMHRESRGRRVGGIMLKRRSSSYGAGRQRGDWWKWKIGPLVIDAVLIQAQPVRGRHAGLFTDCTFGLWENGKLVPVARAHLGLGDAEILEVDAFVRANTTGKFGPSRAVRPELVFELAFETVEKSARHKAGLTVTFPRMKRWRRDRKPADADALETLRALLLEPACE